MRAELMVDDSPEISRRDGVTMIRLGSDYEVIDSADDVKCAALRSLMLEAVRAADPALLVVNVKSTTFIGSVFVTILLNAWNEIQGNDGGRLAICCVNEQCRAVLKTTRMDTLLEVCDSEDEAVRRLSSQK